MVQHLNGQAGGGLSFGVAGLASVSASGSLSESSQVNQSAGFSQSGFEALVRRWLDEIFAVQGNGGVVCIIDNVE
jgi:hypothetical protein